MLALALVPVVEEVVAVVCPCFVSENPEEGAVRLPRYPWWDEPGST